MRTLGLDEAGRGCVLGPLLVGGFCCDAAQLEQLRAAGADDSKKLSPARREQAHERLLSLGEYRLISISPPTIDAGNINQLEEAAFLELIHHFAPDHVIIDAPCNPRAIPNFLARLQSKLKIPSPHFTVEPKADGTYPACGAASIFAKVARDAEIEKLGAVGSGYPSDPVTRAWILDFLQRGEALPSSVRTRWGTIDKIREEAGLPPMPPPSPEAAASLTSAPALQPTKVPTKRSSRQLPLL